MPSTVALDNSLVAVFAGEASDGVISVYVFGSHAEGRTHRESDIDVAVLLARERYPDEKPHPLGPTPIVESTPMLPPASRR